MSLPAVLQHLQVLEASGLVRSEKAVYLDGYDGAVSREQGSRWLLDKLEASLKEAPARA
jgi:hypothetical protein